MLSSVRAPPLVAFVVAVAGACTPPVPGCDSDADCSPGQSCDGLSCVGGEGEGEGEGEGDDPCGGVDERGQCDGDVLTYCGDDGLGDPQLVEIDCAGDEPFAEANAHCALISDSFGFDCALPDGGSCIVDGAPLL
ncbi:MAG TPA: hypothetical protein VGO62_14925, partial [Myxococcota bacterium]